MILRTDQHSVLASKIEKPPREAGIYGIFIDDELIYVGKSNNMRSRFEMHLWAVFPDKIQAVQKAKKSTGLYEAILFAHLANKKIKFKALHITSLNLKELEKETLKLSVANGAKLFNIHHNVNPPKKIDYMFSDEEVKKYNSELPDMTDEEILFFKKQNERFLAFIKSDEAKQK